MESVEYKGMWWKPENTDKKINGKFCFNTDNGGILELDGVLDGKTHSTIYGVTNNGKQITLQQAFDTEWKRHSAGIQGESRIYVNRAFIGGLLQDDPKFVKFMFRTTLLDEWVNISGFDIKHDFEGHKFEVKYKLPEPVEIYRSEEVRIKIDINAKSPSLNFVQKEATISQKTYITIETVTDKELSFFFGLIYKIQNLISFATLKPVVPIEVLAYCSDVYDEVGDKRYPSGIEVLYLPTGKRKDFDVLPPNMLFSYNDIKETIVSKVAKWLEKSEELSPIFNIFFGDMYRPSGFLEPKFLGLVQAAEAYHRRTSCNCTLSEEEHKKRIDAIITATPLEYKEWLKKKLEYSNEPNLRSRLKQLYDDNKIIIEALIKRKEFVCLSVNTRNYLTHYDKSLESSIASGRQLLFLIQVYKTLLLLCMLRELEFSREEIEVISKKFDVHRMEFI